MSRFFHKNDQDQKCHIHGHKHGHGYKAWIGLRAGFSWDGGEWGNLWFRSGDNNKKRKEYKQEKYIEHNIPTRKI